MMVIFLLPWLVAALSPASDGASGGQLNSDLQRTFQQMYDNSSWGVSVGSRSGPGSSHSMTRNAVAALLRVVQEHNISSMVDVPCGDATWMNDFLSQAPPKFRYLGVDIVPSVVEQNRAKSKFPSATHQYQVADASSEVLNGYELIHCRDMLQHLPKQTALQTLQKLTASNAKYLILTSYPDSNNRAEAQKAGDYYPYNLLAPPFNLPTPLAIIADKQHHLAEPISGRDDSDYLLFQMPLSSHSIWTATGQQAQ